MAQISVVIATENCFEKIDAMMLSLFRQSLDDIEIICVDNGSTDGTLGLLQNYAKFDKRVKVIEQKKSAGLLACCSIGLKEVCAPYVMFLNGSHHLLFAQAFLERLLDSAVQYNSDVVYTPVVLIDAVRFTAYSIDIFPKEIFDESVLTQPFKAEDVKGGLLMNFYLSPYLKLYQTEFAKGLDYQAYDEPFFLEALYKAERISGDFDFLCYRQVHKEEFIDKNVIEAQNANRHTLEKYGAWEKLKNAYISRKMRAIWRMFQCISAKEREALFEKMKAEFTTEKFAEYDFNLLRKSKLYWHLQSISNMTYQDWCALQSEPADEQK